MSTEQRFLLRKDVQDRTALPESTLYELIAKGDFPKPIKLTARRVAWLEFDVSAWMDARIAASRGK